MKRIDPTGLLLRVSSAIAYCFLVLSGLLFIGMSFGAAFLTTIRIENRLEQPIRVTPVGTVGPNGARYPLPVSYRFVVPLPAAERGGFELKPNEMREITYDMDDINFSEIVVERENEVIGQIVVDPNPTANQYHAPQQKHFVVDHESLVAVPKEVFAAATRAKQPSHGATVLTLLLVVPWPAVFLLSWLKRRHSAKTQTDQAT